MNIAKRVLSILVCLAIIIPSYGVVFAAADNEVILNETFDEYITFETPELNIVGFRSRIEELGEKNKVLAFYSDTAKQAVNFDGAISDKNYFVSFDIQLDGPVNGNVYVLKGTTENNILSIANGSVATHNGNRFAGISRNKFTNIAIEVNAKSNTYNVYVNGKKYINNYHNDKTINALTGFGINLKSEKNQTVYIDNARIVAGKYNKDISYNKVEYNPEAAEDTGVYEPQVTNEIYMNYGFEPTDRKYTMAYQKKEHVMEIYKLEDGNSVCLFERNGNGDMHLDVTDTSVKRDVSTSIVYQHNLWIDDNNVAFNFNVKDSNSQYIYFYKILNGALTQMQGGSASMKLELKKWHNIAVVYNWYQSTFDLVVNGEYIARNASCATAYDHTIGSIFRFHISAGDSKARFYVDNMRIYGGSEPRELEAGEGTEIKDVELEVNQFTIFPSENSEIQMMKDKVGYHPLTGVAYYDKTKKMLPRGEKVDGIDMGPADFFNFAYGAEVKVDEASGVITLTGSGRSITMSAGSTKMNASGSDQTLSVAPYIKNGVAYVPLVEVGSKAFGKKTYILDDSKSNTGDIKSNSGAIVMSDSEISFPDASDTLHKLCNFLAFYRPSAKEIEAAYEASPRKGQHPRVLATEEDFERIKRLNETDEYFQKNVQALIAYADNWCVTPTLIYELRDGVRLWYVSQEFERAVQELIIAYKITGDTKYKDRIWEDIKAVANFPDWHTEHHIDTGGLALGYGLAYDWLYHEWTEEQRDIMIKGAKNNGFSVYIDGLEGRNSGMYGGYRMVQNHNCVMTSGGAALAAAFADELPEICAYVEAGMIRSHEYMAQTFAPDGQWFEGTGYGAMTLQYTSHFFAITEEIWGSLYGMDYSEGTPDAANFHLYMQSPTTGNFGFYDGESKNISSDSGALWWAKHYNRPYLTKIYVQDYKQFKVYDQEDRGRFLLWYNPDDMNAEIPDFPKNIHYTAIDVVTARDSWDGTQAFFAAKGGSAIDTHGHMDATHFVFHSGGTAWEELSGTSNYNIDGWWDYTGTQGKRWQFYVARAEGHNVAIVDPVADEAEYMPDIRVSYDIYKEKPRGVIASCDTTDLHNGKVKSGRRGFFFTDDRRSLVVREEFVLDKAKDVYTIYHSAYKPEVDGNKVTIKNGAEVLTIEYISNKPLEVVVEENQTMHKDSSIIARVGNGGYKIYAKVNGSGDVNITAKYTPNLVSNPTPITNYDKPIAQWEIPDGEIPERPSLETLKVGDKELSIKNFGHNVEIFTAEIPQTIATSSRYIVEINQATDVKGTTSVKVIDPNDPNNFTLYAVQYTRVGAPVGFDDVEEYVLAGFEASEEPEITNPAKNLFDRNLNTRWSAEGEQNMLLDLGETKPVDTVMLAFYNGKSRQYHIWVEVSTDGTNYTKVFEGKSAGDTTDYERFSFPVQNARYVRVCGNGSNVNGWNSWADMAIGVSK